MKKITSVLLGSLMIASLGVSQEKPKTEHGPIVELGNDTKTIASLYNR